MNKLLAAAVCSAPLFLLTGCTIDATGVDTVVYDPGYSSDYVYSVNYYSNRPYWGNNYYPVYYGTGLYNTDYGYWGGGYYNGY
jgi:hypothetical protein